MGLKRALYYLIAGTLWGCLAALLGSHAFGERVWMGVLASPLIGLAVGALSQPAFERMSGTRRALVALGSVYVGATLFGAVMGLGASFGGTGRGAATELVETVVTVWWGVTVGAFVLFLWPLAYFTHWLIEWRETA
jgi:hypothetical protein